jgi:hypothetical protein
MHTRLHIATRAPLYERTIQYPRPQMVWILRAFGLVSRETTISSSPPRGTW